MSFPSARASEYLLCSPVGRLSVYGEIWPHGGGLREPLD